MGWFWADDLSKFAPAVVAPTSAACPMHKPSDSNAAPFPPRLDQTSSTTSSCPVKSPNHPLKSLANPQPSSASEQEQQRHAPPSTTTSSSFSLSKLNPLNYMPSLSNARPADSPQQIALPLEREISSIPRGDTNSNWEYPSPQQMFNAMLRKGYTDTPADAVESMVAVHNFLNEGAWQEIEEWERVFGKGFGHAWEVCSRGEQGIALDRARNEMQSARRQALGLLDPDEEIRPRLVRFMGRPGDPTPKARMLSFLGTVMPEKFGREPPFDRHDWYVARNYPDGKTQEVRYVIDYYSGGVQETGEPVFYLDIRPALDTPTAAVERAMRWGGDVWHRASGGAARVGTEQQSRSER
ncbi:cytochrome c heme-lyase [Exophiala viscosa]|uniref:cytochrome c heme-lyase n=1 Tax=Exophiala viscosa TaxID=2486360 RepID=UPI00219BD558|nr:cytochrome c heme-lyase [Exophiala viscosa]